MDDGNVQALRVHYVPGTFSVYLDDMERPVLRVPLDIGSALALEDGRAWVGFTAATGGGCQTHDLLSWSFTSGAEPLAPAAVYGDVDADGRLSPADAVAVLRAVVGLAPLTGEAAAVADVNRDGRVNYADVQAILMTAFWNTVVRQEQPT